MSPLLERACRLRLMAEQLADSLGGDIFPPRTYPARLRTAEGALEDITEMQLCEAERTLAALLIHTAPIPAPTVNASLN